MRIKDNETYCAYCGQRYPLDDKAAALVTEHIYTCEKHPMRIPEAQRDELLRVVVEYEQFITINYAYCTSCDGRYVDGVMNHKPKCRIKPLTDAIIFARGGEGA